MIDGLAFLPVTKVPDGYSHLQNICPPEGQELLDYVGTTYVNGSFKPALIGDVTMRVRRVPVPFPPQVWNVHEATLTGNARTNNLCEGWNTRFQSLVGHHHPSIWSSLLPSSRKMLLCQFPLPRKGWGTLLTNAHTKCISTFNNAYRDLLLPMMRETKTWLISLKVLEKTCRKLKLTI